MVVTRRAYQSMVRFETGCSANIYATFLQLPLSATIIESPRGVNTPIGAFYLPSHCISWVLGL